MARHIKDVQSVQNEHCAAVCRFSSVPGGKQHYVRGVVDVAGEHASHSKAMCGLPSTAIIHVTVVQLASGGALDPALLTQNASTVPACPGPVFVLSPDCEVCAADGESNDEREPKRC